MPLMPVIEKNMGRTGSDRVSSSIKSACFFPSESNPNLCQKGPFFSTLYSANTLIISAPSTVTVKHKMMSAETGNSGCPIFALVIPSVYDSDSMTSSCILRSVMRIMRFSCPDRV
jgi:hypothetical protein